MRIAYLNEENDEKIEVSYSSELFKQIFWYKVPKCVLKTNAQIMSVHERNIICILCSKFEQVHSSQLKTKLNKNQ